MSSPNRHISSPTKLSFLNFCAGFRGQHESLWENEIKVIYGTDDQHWVFPSSQKLALYFSEKEATSKVGSASYLLFIHTPASSQASGQPARWWTGGCILQRICSKHIQYHGCWLTVLHKQTNLN